MKQIKVGQIGKGKFGGKILSKLKEINNVSIEWVCGSQDKWWNQEKVEWVVIASPNEFHYEQAKYFISQGINVFCEKPGTLCSQSLVELIELSKANNVYFYIDDVLVYEKPLYQSDFVYKKWGGNSLNIIDRMAYHHFYLIYSSVKNQKLSSIYIRKNKNNYKSFTINYEQPDPTGYGIMYSRYDFEYDFDWYKEKIHNISPQFKGDALKEMLSQVLFKNADFETNLERSLFATKLSEKIKSKMYGKCAVIGAGIYGITAATKLRTSGYDVDLFEAENDILSAASGINQYRIHRGYHYPRSIDTIKSCKDNEQSFIKYYNKSIVNNNSKHYYSVAKEDSLTTPEQYLIVLDKTGLEWNITETLPSCDLTVEVKEKFYNPTVLKKICYNRIKGNGINLKLNNRINKPLKGYVYNVHSTYASLNELTENKQDYQFELCEKPLFKLPEKYKNKSLVIMDGPFMCFDPYADTEYHLGGNVVHAIHTRNIGKKPEIPPPYKRYLNKGIIKNPKYTNIDRFIESAKKFFPDIEKAKHLGSMYTIRTVLPYKDDTDERPTIVKKQKNNFILFSGKIGNCVEAADQIIKIIKDNNL